MPPNFRHEKLDVYRHAIEFVVLSSEISANLPNKLAVKDQLERASTSIPLNIAEGNGKFTAKDKCRFLDIARGSALECAACLDVLVAKNILTKDEADQPKVLLDLIVAMLVGLIRSLSECRKY
jgi:four helix bundle protein